MVFHRYVAIGDSFTEGVGDLAPDRPNGLRGWADRVAETLAAHNPDFRYANLAIRGRKIHRIISEQLAPALALQPDLVSIHAGANDLLRPRVNVEAIREHYDDAVRQLRGSGAAVVMFTTFDPGSSTLFAPLRGRMALYNEFVREISDTYGCVLVDMWRMRTTDSRAVFADDRIHLNERGHLGISIAVLDALGVAHSYEWTDPDPAAPVPVREQIARQTKWTREHLVPWVGRRLTGRSSGDVIGPKRPELGSVAAD